MACVIGAGGPKGRRGCRAAYCVLSTVVQHEIAVGLYNEEDGSVWRKQLRTLQDMHACQLQNLLNCSCLHVHLSVHSTVTGRNFPAHLAQGLACR